MPLFNTRKALIGLSVVLAWPALGQAVEAPGKDSQTCTADADGGQGEARAPINTSRSNKKHAMRAGPGGQAGPDAARAPISTSRSNKKHGMVVAPDASSAEANPKCLAPGSLRDVKPIVAGSVVVRKPPRP